MGARGPRPTPKRILDNRGSWRAKTRKDEPTPAPGLPPCPDFLDDAARAEWSRISLELLALGLLTNIDRAALAAYCVAWSRWQAAETKINDLGIFVAVKRRHRKGAQGGMVVNPWLAVADRAMKQMREFAGEFGMTPATRTRAAAAKPSSGDKPRQAFFD
jgi:P27 family predicted phage terminase small subunit